MPEQIAHVVALEGITLIKGNTRIQGPIHISSTLHSGAGTEISCKHPAFTHHEFVSRSGFPGKICTVVVDTVEISRGNLVMASGTVQDRAQWPEFRILSPKAHKICNRRSPHGWCFTVRCGGGS